jgi:hypothetical protein
VVFEFGGGIAAAVNVHRNLPNARCSRQQRGTRGRGAAAGKTSKKNPLSDQFIYG